MSCPFMKSNSATSSNINNAASTDAGMLYGDYLMLDKLLSCQEPVTRYKFTQLQNCEVHDEHLFIITHQAYELWFKQIIYELDSVRVLLDEEHVDEANMLKISSRLNRVKKIFDILTEQFSILSTMTPLDFMDFRDYLAPASGFQSFQFRLMENKLGIRNELRTNYRKGAASQQYHEVFRDLVSIEAIKKSEQEPSLCQLIERWLERTPGLEQNGFNFWEKYKNSIKQMLKDEFDNEMKKLEARLASMPNCTPEIERAEKDLFEQGFKKKETMYDDFLNESMHNQFVQNGTRRFSHKATQGALIIFLYRDEPRFNQPYQLLVTLMDIDDLLIKWRQNHAQMVLRMIGGQLGTGGSSGYNYLRTTISQKYNIFLDLFNLSTYLPPKAYIPKLTNDMRKQINSYHS